MIIYNIFYLKYQLSFIKLLYFLLIIFIGGELLFALLLFIFIVFFFVFSGISIISNFFNIVMIFNLWFINCLYIEIADLVSLLTNKVGSILDEIDLFNKWNDSNFWNFLTFKPIPDSFFEFTILFWEFFDFPRIEEVRWILLIFFLFQYY